MTLHEFAALLTAVAATTAQVRLAWALRRGPHVLVIPGTGDPHHVADNVAAGAVRLSDDDLARLDAVHRSGSG